MFIFRNAANRSLATKMRKRPFVPLVLFRGQSRLLFSVTQTINFFAACEDLYRLLATPVASSTSCLRAFVPQSLWLRLCRAVLSSFSVFQTYGFCSASVSSVKSVALIPGAGADDLAQRRRVAEKTGSDLLYSLRLGASARDFPAVAPSLRRRHRSLRPSHPATLWRRHGTPFRQPGVVPCSSQPY